MTEPGSYRVEFRWKEEIVSWEGDRGFLFDGGWGGRHAEVVGRLREQKGHSVVEFPDFVAGDWRSVRA